MRAVIVEEHHEAFFVWHYARAQGWFGPDPVALVHADAFPDLAVPRLRRPLREIGTPEDAARLAYDDLAINNYIWPAVYQGFFDEIFWLRTHHSESVAGSRTIRIAAESELEMTFRTSDRVRGGPIGGGDKTVRYQPVTSCELPARRPGLVLSIDLACFGADTQPALAGGEIEITAGAYREFVSSPYHFTRLVFHCKAEASHRDGRFYLALNRGVRATPAIRPREVVERRIDELCALFTGLEPSVVVISRSCHSGYVEEGNADFAVERLLSHLRQMAPVETHRVDDLLAEVRYA